MVSSFGESDPDQLWRGMRRGFINGPERMVPRRRLADLEPIGTKILFISVGKGPTQISESAPEPCKFSCVLAQSRDLSSELIASALDRLWTRLCGQFATFFPAEEVRHSLSVCSAWVRQPSENAVSPQCTSFD